MFIQHYSQSATFVPLTDYGYEFRFASGRTLEFIKIPYAPSSGSFMTFDRETGILFSSDLFSSYVMDWGLFLQLPSECRKCRGEDFSDSCGRGRKTCAIMNILRYHQDIMTSERALKHAMDQVSGLPFQTVAPHQGSVVHEAEDIVLLCQLLSTLQGVGIDRVVGGRSFYDLGNVRPIMERMMRR